MTLLNLRNTFAQGTKFCLVNPDKDEHRINIMQKAGDSMEVLIEVIAYAAIWALCGGLKRYK